MLQSSILQATLATLHDQAGHDSRLASVARGACTMAVRPSTYGVYSTPLRNFRQPQAIQHLSPKLESIPSRQDGLYAFHSDGSVGS